MPGHVVSRGTGGAGKRGTVYHVGRSVRGDIGGTLTARQAAQVLGVTVKVVYRWLHDGTLAGARDGAGRWRIERPAVEALARRRRA